MKINCSQPVRSRISSLVSFVKPITSSEVLVHLQSSKDVRGRRTSILISSPCSLKLSYSADEFPRLLARVTQRERERDTHTHTHTYTHTHKTNKLYSGRNGKFYEMELQ